MSRMSGSRRARRPFWYLRRGSTEIDADVREELNVHVQMRVEELTARGIPTDTARQESLRQFGDLEYTQRYCRQQGLDKEKHMHRRLLLDDLVQDVRMSCRGLLRAPVLTITIVLTVGLGIGATTTIFGAIDAALLRPLPYQAPDQLVRIYTDSPPNRFPLSVADYLALVAQQTHFDRIAAYSDRQMAFSDGSVAERIRGREVSPTYFALLGIHPALGRDFTEQDGRPGAPRAVIVSHGFWQRRLGGSPNAIGRTIRLDGWDYVVAGVLPHAVGPLEDRQEFFAAGQWKAPTRKGPFFLTVIGRLTRTADRAAAADELRAINRSLFPIWRASYQDEKATWSMIDLHAHVTRDAGTIAGVALAAVVLVWLIACANASNLLVARITSRRRELAVRTALGASRGRVVRYLLAESCVLSVGAASVGTALTWIGVALFREFGQGYFPRTGEVAFDAPSAWLLAGLAACSAMLFGLVPALHGSGGPVDEALRSSGRSSTGTISVRRLRRALVATQFAIATPLLVIAVLLLASLNALGRVDLGFDTRNVLTGSIQLPPGQYREPGQMTAFWTELRGRIAALPGVSGVAFADGRPPDDVGNFNNFDLEDSPTQAGESQPVTPWVSVTPEYFGVLGLTLLEGRLLNEQDALRPNLEAVVVDRPWAARFFPNRSAVGRRFKEGGCTACPWTTVVGVVSEVKYAGLDKPDEGTVYWPMDGGSRFRNVVLRTGTDPASVLPAVRRVVRELDAGVPFTNAATADDLIARSLQRPRSLSALIAGFAVVALILSIVGIYGVMAYYVQQHAKDIGVRLALGGSPGDVLRLIVGQAMKVVTSGVAIGLLASLATTRMISGLLFGVGAVDARSFAAVSVLLIGVALMSCLVPALRAMRLEPSAVLRDE
jgi:putative ABC transport system permease protein